MNSMYSFTTLSRKKNPRVFDFLTLYACTTSHNISIEIAVAEEEQEVATAKTFPFYKLIRKEMRNQRRNKTTKLTYIFNPSNTSPPSFRIAVAKRNFPLKLIEFEKGNCFSTPIYNNCVFFHVHPFCYTFSIQILYRCFTLSFS